MSLKVKIYVRLAWALLILSLIGWPATHVLIVLTQPQELGSWVGHLLLALSWGAITITAYGIIVTTDIKKEQDDGTDD